MTNNPTRAMPTAEEIDSMSDNLRINAQHGQHVMDDLLDASRMLRAIVDHLRKSEPVAWMEPNEGGYINALTKREVWATAVYTIPLYTTPLADADDARRYRWLCNQRIDDGLFIASGSTGTWGECGHSDWGGMKGALDERIDTAMKEDRHD